MRICTALSERVETHGGGRVLSGVYARTQLSQFGTGELLLAQDRAAYVGGAADEPHVAEAVRVHTKGRIIHRRRAQQLDGQGGAQ